MFLPGFDVSIKPGAEHQPRGFDQTLHMIVAAFMVTGFGIAGVYAVALLRGRRDRYHRLGFAIPFTVAAVLSPVQVVVGDWAAHFVGEYQPTKLAAMEGLARTQAGAPLSLGGVYVDGELRYAVEVPNALSLLASWDPDAVVMGLDQVPDDQEPPVTVVKWAFQLMVAIGFGLVALSAWWALAWWRRRGPPRSPWFLRAAALSGVAAFASTLYIPLTLAALGIIGRGAAFAFRKASHTLTEQRRVTAALAVAAVLWAWGAAQHPDLLPPDLTVTEAAGDPTVLATVLAVLAVGALLLAPSLLWLFGIFQRSKPAAGNPPPR